MKLQSTTGSMVVDYYPVQLSSGDISANHLMKVVKFQGIDTMSTSFVTKRTFERECAERIGIGYNVVDFNTTPQLGNPMAGAC
jgi:hypothetical protein